MKRQKSVTLFIEIVLALGIIVYTIILDAIVFNRLDNGLKSYFTSEIKEQSASFTAEFTEELGNIANSVLNSKNTYESMQKNGINQKEISDIVCTK